jgi:lipid II:glycine glycyltransferase (peptidoglycan interpeptide bridge formation enzyme)
VRKHLVVKEILSEGEWSKFLQMVDYKHFQQDWRWGEFNKALGKRVFRWGIYEDQKLVAVCLGIDEPSKFGKLVYCPRGPVLDWSDVSLAERVVETLVEHVRSLSEYIFLRLDPGLLREDETLGVVFKGQGFHRSVGFWQVERAWVLDIKGKTDDELMLGMRKNARYSLRKAMKSGVEVAFSHNLKEVEKFAEMLEKMSQRKGFAPMPKAYLLKQYEMLGGENGFLRFYTASKDGEMIAGAVVAFYGDQASYLHGASSDLGDSQAPYLLQWRAIQDAREAGLDKYNFWGVVEDKNYHPGYPGFGYSNFKRGFGGRVEQYIHTQDHVYKALPYKLFSLQERYRQWRYKGN